MEEPLTPAAGTPQPDPSGYPPAPSGYPPAPSGYPPTASGYPPAPPSYTNPPRRKKVWPWFVGGGVVVLGFITVISVLLYSAARSFSSSDDGFSSLGDNIGVIDIDGEILSAESTVDQLRRYDQDSSIKAILLHINSPGGAAAPSQEIYHEVLKIRDEKKKPIVVSIESVGASGAYYIASGANKIYANDASVVGSIGVIMEWTNYGDLLTWAKMKPEVIHAGSLKDAGDPTHAITPEERVYFQGLVDNMYGQFVTDVANGRHIPADQVKALATGQVWTGEQALPLHLIDKQGGFRDALLDTAKSVGITDEPNVVKPFIRRKSIWDLISNADDLVHQPTKLIERRPGFYFLWR